jgi:hypothetical protein
MLGGILVVVICGAAFWYCWCLIGRAERDHIGQRAASASQEPPKHPNTESTILGKRCTGFGGSRGPKRGPQRLQRAQNEAHSDLPKANFGQAQPEPETASPAAVGGYGFGASVNQCWIVQNGVGNGRSGGWLWTNTRQTN